MGLFFGEASTVGRHIGSMYREKQYQVYKWPYKVLYNPYHLLKDNIIHLTHGFLWIMADPTLGMDWSPKNPRNGCWDAAQIG